MALKPTPPGATGVGTNQPTRGAGLTDEEEQEQKFLAEKLKEEEKEKERRGLHPPVQGKSGPATKDVGPPGFKITNTGGVHVNVSQGGVNPDGTPRWTTLKHLDPGEFMDFTNSVEALKIKVEEE